MWCLLGEENCRFAIDRARRGMLNWNCGDIGLGVFLMKGECYEYEIDHK